MHPMLIAILVIAAVLLLAFAAVWFKDRNRTHEQASDDGRLDP